MMIENEILLYTTKDGDVKIDVLYNDQTMWLTQKRIASLFGCTPENISMHLQNIYNTEELTKISTTKEFLLVQDEGTRSIKRNVLCYNLEAIIAVGYCINPILIDYL